MRTQAICVALAIVLLCPFTSAQWVQTDVPYGGPVSCIAVSGANIFAGTRYGGGVYLSTNSGASWTAVNTGLPTSNDIASLFVSDTNIFVGTEENLFVSTNSGTSWAKTSLNYCPVAFAKIPGGEHLFAGTQSMDTTGGVFHSTDNGTTWTRVCLGLTKLYVNCLASCGTNLFAGTGGGGVFRSTNNGETWTAVNSGLPDSGMSWFNPRVVASLAVNGTKLFAGTFRGVFLSTDNGETWCLAHSGLPANDFPVCFAVSGTNVFAGMTGSRGVFLSSNGGSSWTHANLGLTDTSVECLAISGSNLFAGTLNGGVWKRPLSEMITSVHSSVGIVPTQFTLDQNYPNPFNPSTTIKFELPRSSEVRLSVFDMLGSEVSVLVNDRRDAGVHEVKFDGAGLSSGVYFYRLQAADFVSTKRMLILK